MTLLAWLAALGGALGYGAASVLQGVGAGRASGPAVLRQPFYVAGLCLDGLAWLASLVALRVLPLFLVQSVLAASVAVTVVLARVFLRTPLRPRDIAALVVLVASLAVLAVAFLPSSAAVAPGLTEWLVGLGALLLVAVGAAYGRGGSLLLAALAGTAFAGAAVAARGVDLSGGVAAVAGEPLAWAVLVLGGAGTVTYARSLERGPVGPATAVLWAVETVVGGVVGVLALGDVVRPGWAVAAGAAVLLSLAGCAVLATGPMEDAMEEAVEPAG